MGELNFTKPINAVPRDGYGSRGGTHKGVDYPASEGTPVQASESGLVLRTADNPKTSDRPRAYGNVIVIDHNPGEADSGKTKGRHIYTLYGHLSEMSVKVGDYVEKYEAIGAVGSTGTSTGAHLHFEIIDSSDKKNWSSDKGAMGVDGEDRKDPEGYFDQTTELEGTLPDIVEQAILDRIEFVPDIDLKLKDPFRLEAYLDGKNIGYLNKDNDAVGAAIKYDLKEELQKIWRKPLRVPENKPIGIELP